MSDFDVEAFVAKLESLGVKLTAVPLADGTMRISRWRMPNAVDASQIDSLWASQIGGNQARMDLLAAHLAPAAAKITGNGELPVRAALRTGEADTRRALTASGSMPVRPSPRTGEADAKSKDRLGTTASGAAPIRPSVRAGEGDSRSKGRTETMAAGAVPPRPSTRTGEADAKSKDRPAGRPHFLRLVRFASSGSSAYRRPSQRLTITS
jgi:hypothetical protein